MHFHCLIFVKKFQSYENAKQNHKTKLSVNMTSDNVYWDLILQIK